MKYQGDLHNAFRPVIQERIKKDQLHSSFFLFNNLHALIAEALQFSLYIVIIQKDIRKSFVANQSGDLRNL